MPYHSPSLVLIGLATRILQGPQRYRDCHRICLCPKWSTQVEIDVFTKCMQLHSFTRLIVQAYLGTTVTELHPFDSIIATMQAIIVQSVAWVRVIG